MAEKIRTGLIDGDFDLTAEVSRVKALSRGIGGVVVFLGTARDLSRGKTVVRLEFEAYREMAGKELESMAGEAVRLFGLEGLVVLHRHGDIPAGENIVLIVAAAAHREQAFNAARWCIDELKKRIPIWKKEVYTNGEVWVQETP